MRTLHLTSPVMTGEDVRAAQRLLARHGFDPGKVDGEYGLLSAAASKRAKESKGYVRKACTPTFGAALYAYLTGTRKPSVAMRLRAQARAKLANSAQGRIDAFFVKALSQLGVHESPAGSNEVLYSRWYGVIGAWCAMFISWVAAQVGITFHESYCPDVVSKAALGRDGLSFVHGPAHGALILALFDWPGESRGEADHIGITITDSDLRRLAPKAHAAAIAHWGTPDFQGGEFWSIEGNTSPTDDSNGGEVWIRRRSRGPVQHFVQVTV